MIAARQPTHHCVPPQSVHHHNQAMSFSLVTNRGRVMQFYIQGVAELYKGLYGGVVLAEEKQDDSRRR